MKYDMKQFYETKTPKMVHTKKETPPQKKKKKISRQNVRFFFAP